MRDLKNRLTAVRREIIAGDTKILTVAAQKQFAGRIASLINADNKWLWFGGVVAFLTVIFLFLFDRRHHLRRLTWVRVSRFRVVLLVIAILLAVPLLPTLVTFLFGNTTNDALLALAAGQDAGNIRYSEKNLEELKRELEVEQGHHRSASEKLKGMREKHSKAWPRHLVRVLEVAVVQRAGRPTTVLNSSRPGTGCRGRNARWP